MSNGLHLLARPVALSVIAYPSGRFGFVGDVPARLGYIYESDDDLKIAIDCGPGFATRAAAANGRVFKTRSYESEAAAWQAYEGLYGPRPAA